MAKGGDGLLMLFALFAIFCIPFFGSGNQTVPVPVPLEVKEEFRNIFFPQYMKRNYIISTKDFGFDPSKIYEDLLIREGFYRDVMCNLKENDYICIVK